MRASAGMVSPLPLSSPPYNDTPRMSCGFSERPFLISLRAGGCSMSEPVLSVAWWVTIMVEPVSLPNAVIHCMASCCAW